MTTTTTTTITERPADMRSAEALAYARQTHPDAVRASYVAHARPGRAKDMIGQRIMLTSGQPALILRCHIEDISALWDGGDRGSNGYRVSLIVSPSAAQV